MLVEKGLEFLERRMRTGKDELLMMVVPENGMVTERPQPMESPLGRLPQTRELLPTGRPQEIEIETTWMPMTKI